MDESAMICAARRIAAFALAMGMTLTARPAMGQRVASLEKAASDLLVAIQKAAGDKSANVLVLDFADPKGSRTELGLRLADEFSDFLGKQPTGVMVVDRQALHDVVARDKLTQADLERANAPTCYADELKATVLVKGRLKTSGAKYDLELTATWTHDPDKKIFEEEVRAKLTDEERGLAKQRASFPTQPEAESILGATVPIGGTRGYSMPGCADCRAPQMSAAAVKAKFQGSVFLTAEIDPDGHPSHLQVIKGLGCGLNEKAIEAVSKWRFKPAIGPDGQPAAVTVPLEVTFHLY